MHADSIMDRIIHNSYVLPSSKNNIRKIKYNENLALQIDELQKEN